MANKYYIDNTLRIYYNNLSSVYNNLSSVYNNLSSVSTIPISSLHHTNFTAGCLSLSTKPSITIDCL